MVSIFNIKEICSGISTATIFMICQRLLGQDALNLDTAIDSTQVSGS